jgi:hypothetical protein
MVLACVTSLGNKNEVGWDAHSVLSRQNEQVVLNRVDQLLENQTLISDCMEKEGEAAVARLFAETNASCSDYPANGVACVKKVQEVVAKTLRSSRSCRCRFYTYIGPNLWLTRPLAAFVKSFLLTQPHSVLHIYSSFPQSSTRTPSIFRDNPYLQGCNLAGTARVQVKDAAEVLSTVQGLRWCSTMKCEVRTGSYQAEPIVALTDLLRMHLLANYGGIWVDGDTLFMRDMSFLCGGSFAYQWDHEPELMNTAMMGCRKGCPVAEWMVRTGGADPKAFHPHKVGEALQAIASERVEAQSAEAGAKHAATEPFKFFKLPQWLFDAEWAHDNMYLDGADHEPILEREEGYTIPVFEATGYGRWIDSRSVALTDEGRAFMGLFPSVRFSFECLFSAPWQGRNSEKVDPNVHNGSVVIQNWGVVDAKPQLGTLGEAYEGALSYHWHNRWDHCCQKESRFVVFEREWDEALQCAKGGAAVAVTAPRTEEEVRGKPEVGWKKGGEDRGGKGDERDKGGARFGKREGSAVLLGSSSSQDNKRPCRSRKRPMRSKITGKCVSSSGLRAEEISVLRKPRGQTKKEKKEEKKTTERKGVCPFEFLVYVYPLPAEYNSDVVQLLRTEEVQDGEWRTGPGLTDDVLDWRTTMLDFMDEVIIQWAFDGSACTTSDPSKATFFFLPISFFYLEWLRRDSGHLASGISRAADFDSLLASGDTGILKKLGIDTQWWDKHGGCDHIVVASRPQMGWENSAVSKMCGMAPIVLGKEFNWGTIERWESRLRSIGANETAMAKLKKAEKGCLCKNVLLPYLTRHPRMLKGSTKRHSRPVLAAFVGSGGRGPREDLLVAMKQCGPCRVFEVKDRSNISLAMENAVDLYESCTFAIVVRGDSATSARAYSAIAMGAIPVFIGFNVVGSKVMFQLPFANTLDWSKFSLNFRPGEQRVVDRSICRQYSL